CARPSPRSAFAWLCSGPQATRPARTRPVRGWTGPSPATCSPTRSGSSCGRVAIQTSGRWSGRGTPFSSPTPSATARPPARCGSTPRPGRCATNGRSPAPRRRPSCATAASPKSRRPGARATPSSSPPSGGVPRWTCGWTLGAGRCRNG
ncbi:MAG: hypothetical protein AVDCRST_MAG08-1533, partial [uncultured Acetobacteraceae bacterium]